MEAPSGHIFHAARRGRVAQARVGRQQKGAPNEASCAACRGVGLIAAGFHCALAGGQHVENRREEIL
eukprot:6275075-Pyramimonas_sp.AAC.1